MDFNKCIRNFVSLSVPFVLVLGLVVSGVGCSVGPEEDKSAEYNVGVEVNSMSSLADRDGNEVQTVVLFDKMLRRIHQFDMATMTPVRSFAVRNPDLEHFVVHGSGGNYIVDLSLKGLSIYNKYNQANHRPIQFQGKPRGVAFDANSGVFVLYDDLSTVGILKLDPNGEVLGRGTRGTSVISGSNAVISSGDIDSKGRIVFAMNDNRIAVVDTAQTLAQNKWVLVAPAVATTLTDIKWLAPLPLANPAANQLIIASSSDKVAVVDTVTGNVLSSHTIDGEVEKMSKSVDPHVVIRKGNNVTVVYAKSGVIEAKPFILGAGQSQRISILSSKLNLAKDTWSFVDVPWRTVNPFNDNGDALDNRWFRRYQLSDSLSTHNIALESEPQIEISDTFIFGLFKDELGYAERLTIQTEEKRTIERFNLRYIPAN